MLYHYCQRYVTHDSKCVLKKLKISGGWQIWLDRSCLFKEKIGHNTNLAAAKTHRFGKWLYRGADKSLARPTSRCILFDGENISFDASLIMYINSTIIPPIMIINRIYDNQNLLSL